MKELNQHLETEKSSRTDLEMYVAVLNTQKSVLQEEVDKLRSELQQGKQCPCKVQHTASLFKAYREILLDLFLSTNCLLWSVKCRYVVIIY